MNTVLRVMVLITQLEDEDIYTPPFQRGYVWDIKMASRFIESLLLGLPVPGIFLSLETNTEKHLIIDGQQRLKTLQFFYRGVFEPTDKSFKLTGVQKDFRGLTIRDLRPEHRRRLNNSVIHATVVRQESPTDDQSSVFHIFERLNSGGKQLAPQEIRTALFNGPLIEVLHELNTTPAWREIYGPKSPQERDVELIVRFLALHFFRSDYSAPLKIFLNRFMGRNRTLTALSPQAMRDAFVPTVNFALEAFPSPFRPQRALNAAVFDGVMDAVARRLQQGKIVDLEAARAAYLELLRDEQFHSGIVRATANERRVEQRFEAAMNAFRNIP